MNYYIDINNKIWGFDDSQKDLIPSDSVEIPSIYTPNQFPYLSLIDGVVIFDSNAYNSAIESEKLASCKSQAVVLLSNTDWSTLTDVTTGSPKLENQDDFIQYREIIREFAINPVADPVWPTIPIEQWS